MKFEIVKVTAKQEYLHQRKGEPYRWRSKMYIWPEGETVLDNLFNRRNRPAKVWQEQVIPVILEKLKETNPEVYEVIKDQKWGWRQKCGCTCPCSPGFVSYHDTGGTFVVSASVKFLEEN